MERLELGKLKIPEREDSLVTGKQNDKFSIHRTESVYNLVYTEKNTNNSLTCIMVLNLRRQWR